MARILTTKELSRYLRLHTVTICKYASSGKIPGIKIGHEWRFDKDVIDVWLSGGKAKTIKKPAQHRQETNQQLKHKLRKKMR